MDGQAIFDISFQIICSSGEARMHGYGSYTHS